MTTLPQVVIYTDGACTGNPGPGGYGVVLHSGPYNKELSGGYRLTTNNRMEIMAAIAGLEALTQPCQVTVYTDSQYLANAVSQGWARKWQANNWQRTKTEKAINADLWQRLLGQLDKHQVSFQWIRGHDGNPNNERCDRLAVQAARQPNLPPDAGYALPNSAWR